MKKFKRVSFMRKRFSSFHEWEKSISDANNTTLERSRFSNRKNSLHKGLTSTKKAKSKRRINDRRITTNDIILSQFKKREINLASVFQKKQKLLDDDNILKKSFTSNYSIRSSKNSRGDISGSFKEMRTVVAPDTKSELKREPTTKLKLEKNENNFSLLKSSKSRPSITKTKLEQSTVVRDQRLEAMKNFLSKLVKSPIGTKTGHFKNKKGFIKETEEKGELRESKSIDSIKPINIKVILKKKQNEFSTSKNWARLDKKAYSQSPYKISQHFSKKFYRHAQINKSMASLERAKRRNNLSQTLRIFGD